MRIIFCENNLAGYFTAIYHNYYTFKDADAITSDSDRLTFLDETFETETDLLLADKVRKGIIKKAGNAQYRDVIDAYLNTHAEKEQYIFDYIKLLLKVGRKAADMFGDQTVVRFNDLVRKVRHEAHRMTGFIRLQEMENGIFYGYFGSDHDVLEIVMKDMLPQYNSQPFILHDIRRKKMIFFDGQECLKLLVPDGVEIMLSETEVSFQSMWKQYFNSVTIESRKNLRLQRQFLPKKYRFFMHEF